MIFFEGAIEIHRHINRVFGFITHLPNIEMMFEHIHHVVPVQAANDTAPPQFRQVRSVHGRQWHETGAVVAVENPSRYTLRLCIFGVEVIHDYTLEAIDSQLTRVHLIRKSQAKGWAKLLYPVIRHLLTRPEHDGNHLNVLKRVIEESVPDAS